MVEAPVVLELQGADRVRDPLDGVRLAVRPIVHRVDAPSVAGPMVMRSANPVHDRIAELHVGRGQIDLGPQDMRSVGELTRPHLGEEGEVLGYRAIAIDALLARPIEITAGRANVLERAAIDV